MKASESERAFQLTDDGDIQMPSLIVTDYVEIVILSIVLLVGIPLNSVVLYRLIGQYGTQKALNRFKSNDAQLRFLILKMHLTIIDLAFIIMYCPSKLVWLICYKWPFGPILCKFVQYSWMFVHHTMSFAIVSIAIDRVKTVFDMRAIKKSGRIANSKHRLHCTKRMIALTYICAAVFSLPQWVVWTTADLSQWSQCTTVWHKIRAQHFLSGSDELEDTFTGEQLYTVIHLITIFWGPFAILIISYACIAIIIIFYSTRTPLASENQRLSQTPAFRSEMQLLKTQNGESSKIQRESRTVDKGPNRWRTACQSRVCHTSAFVILAYLLCWLPYNFLALAMFFNRQLSVSLSIHYDIVRVFVIFNALLNPFIYGFQKKS